MELTLYIIAVFTSFLGLFSGLALSYIAEEELKGGKKFFIISRYIIFLLIFIITIFYSFKNNYNHILITSSIILIASLIISKQYKNYSEIFNYSILGVLFYTNTINNTLFLITASSIFIYGLTAGTLFRIKNRSRPIETIKKLSINYFFFIIIAILPFLILG